MKKTEEAPKTPPKGYPKGKPRPATYYKLGEKDHPTIIEGLRHYASVYHIALKIGCGYTTLKLYLHKHPELMAVQKEAQDSVAEFVESQIVRKCANGYFPALAFYAERKMGWTQHQLIENVSALPIISFGLIPESQLPPEDNGEEVKQLEEEYLRGDKKADQARKDAQEKAKGSEGTDGMDDEPIMGGDDLDAGFFGISADAPPMESGMFGGI